VAVEETDLTANLILAVAAAVAVYMMSTGIIAVVPVVPELWL
jgi:hypothetical protein